MFERYVNLGDEWLFLRHSDLLPKRKSLLFIHGLGESGLCFTEAFEQQRLLDFNLVVPDLVGYGRSSVAQDGNYCMFSQLDRLRRLVSQLQLGPLTLIGHSLGGILATYWARMDGPPTIERPVNIEGNLTPADTTFSLMAVVADRMWAGDFGLWCRWFRRDFMERLILHHYGSQWESCRRYYASLCYGRPEAFRANAYEAYADSQLVDGTAISRIGREYDLLQIPKIYCWGAKSLSECAQDFLRSHGLLNRAFPEASHWPMIDCPRDFYAFLRDWL